MPEESSKRTVAKLSAGTHAPRKEFPTCKTCRPCRQKKVKCDGSRPRCRQCESTQVDCIYLRDYRKETRPAKARVQSLENTVARMLEYMMASGVELPELPELNRSEGVLEHDSLRDENQLVANEEVAPLPTPSASTASPSEPASRPGPTTCAVSESVAVVASRPENAHEDRLRTNCVDLGTMSESILEPQVFDEGPQQSRWRNGLHDGNVSNLDDGGCATVALSHCEARVAGVFHERGCVSSVHGLAGVMNPNLRALHKKNISTLKFKGETAITESKARLISNTALQKQRESRLFRQPRNFMDLDGCAPELAKHLLDLHFNRHHHGYVLTYRPAFMDSLANGGGPWVNKLLLNAVYYSSAMYSDWKPLQSDLGSAEAIGAHFYQRFKALLAAEFDEPSLATAAALLLMGGSLVSQGRSSAGWTLSGTAYRMIMDLGCHMIIGADYQDGQSTGQLLRLDLEQELRKRLYWGAYVADASQALYLGRPCMFACVEARVPLQFLDTFEELEMWEPSEYSAKIGSERYHAQPTYAVSTFMSMVRLLQISTKITELYGIQSIKLNSDTLLDKWRSIDWKLDDWRDSLPSHLRLDPDSIFAPPPHQITLHTTHHALTILLHRAFLEEGHLRRHSNDSEKRRGEAACISSALTIEKYVKMYRNAFSLRRAPFLLSYAAYSAVTVILHENQHDRSQFATTISFFWTCLNELHRGSNSGLKKPLAIIQDVVRELQISIDPDNSGMPELQLQPSLEQSSFNALGINKSITGKSPGIENPGNYNASFSDDWNIINSSDPTYGLARTESLDFLNQQEMDISHDALYGLFAPTQHYA